MSTHPQTARKPTLFSYTNPAKFLNYEVIYIDENRKTQSYKSKFIAQLPLISGNLEHLFHLLFKLLLASSQAFSFPLPLREKCLKIPLLTKEKKKRFNFSLYLLKARWLFRRDVNSHISGQSFSVIQLLPLCGLSHLPLVSFPLITEESKYQSA